MPGYFPPTAVPQPPSASGWGALWRLLEPTFIGRGWNSPVRLGDAGPVAGTVDRVVNIPLQGLADLLDTPAAIAQYLLPQWQPDPFAKAAGRSPYEVLAANRNMPWQAKEILPFLAEFAGAAQDPGMLHANAVTMDAALSPAGQVAAGNALRQGARAAKGAAVQAAVAPMKGLQEALGAGTVTGTPLEATTVTAPFRRSGGFARAYVPVDMRYQQAVAHLSEEMPGNKSLSHVVAFASPEEAVADVYARFPEMRGKDVPVSELRIPERELLRVDDPRYKRALGAWSTRIGNKAEYSADPAAVLRSVFYEAQRQKENPNIGFIVGMEIPPEIEVPGVGKVRRGQASSEFGPLAESWVQPTRAFNETYMGEPFSLTPEQRQVALRRATTLFNRPVEVSLGEAKALARGYQWDPARNVIGAKVWREAGKRAREAYPRATVGRLVLDPRDQSRMETVRLEAQRLAIEDFAAKHPDLEVPHTLRFTAEQFDQAANNLGYTHIFNPQSGHWRSLGLPIPEDSPAVVQTRKVTSPQPKVTENKVTGSTDLRRLTADQPEWQSLQDQAVHVQQDLMKRYGVAPSVKDLFEEFVHRYAGTHPIDVFQTLDDAGNPLPVVDEAGVPTDVYTKRFLAQTGMSKKLAAQGDTAPTVPITTRVATQGGYRTRILRSGSDEWNQVRAEAEELAQVRGVPLDQEFNRLMADHVLKSRGRLEAFEPLGENLQPTGKLTIPEKKSGGKTTTGTEETLPPDVEEEEVGAEAVGETVPAPLTGEQIMKSLDQDRFRLFMSRVRNKDAGYSTLGDIGQRLAEQFPETQGQVVPFKFSLRTHDIAVPVLGEPLVTPDNIEWLRTTLTSNAKTVPAPAVEDMLASFSYTGDWKALTERVKKYVSSDRAPIFEELRALKQEIPVAKPKKSRAK